MQGWRCETLTGVNDLRWGPIPQTEPGPGQVRVKVVATSLNFPDLLIVEGKYQFRPELPFVPGSEYAGVVEAAGEGVRAGRRRLREIAAARTGETYDRSGTRQTIRADDGNLGGRDLGRRL